MDRTDPDYADVDPELLDRLEKGQERWIPDIIQSLNTPAENTLASPLRQALLGALVGGGAGAGVGGMIGSKNNATGIGAAVGGLGGAGLGAGMAALLRYIKNQDNTAAAIRSGAKNPKKYDILNNLAMYADSVKFASSHSGDGVAKLLGLKNEVHEEPSEDLKKQISKGEKRWIPDIIQHMNTPVEGMMADPGRQAILGALAGGGLGSLSFATDMHPAAAAGITAGGAGLGAGLTALLRHISNEDVKVTATRAGEERPRRFDVMNALPTYAHTGIGVGAKSMVPMRLLARLAIRAMADDDFGG